MTDKPVVKFIIIHESVSKSWMRDSSTFALFAGLILLGVFVGSSTMEWAGFILAFFVLFSRVAEMNSGLKRMTREEAIEHLQNGDV
ncbi:hypothetical protein [Rhizobium alvei]|uniref:Uncharacterized protein n=1 Tax=Rhizobium alvei TaxID=1132659 RepID=A0ABT8YT81_9HYPH|nr:hypothetical protein [Rhizobium alvei]MDO6966949.1 hypothetical protein [Rhizobium alvei]